MLGSIIAHILRAFRSAEFDWRLSLFWKLFEHGVTRQGEADVLFGVSARAETALYPFFEVRHVRNFLHIVLHHIAVPCGYEDLFAVPDILQQVLIVLLLLDYLLLDAQVLPLLADLFLLDIVDTQLS